MCVCLNLFQNASEAPSAGKGTLARPTGRLKSLARTNIHIRTFIDTQTDGPCYDEACIIFLAVSNHVLVIPR